LTKETYMMDMSDSSFSTYHYNSLDVKHWMERTAIRGPVFDDLSDGVVVFVRDFSRPTKALRQSEDREIPHENGWAIVLSVPLNDAQAEGDVDSIAWELESVSSSCWTTSRRTFRDALLLYVDHEIVDFTPSKRRSDKNKSVKVKTKSSGVGLDDGDEGDLVSNARYDVKSRRGGKFCCLLHRNRNGEKTKQIHQRTR
jgi:hypothetical protein